MTSRRTVLSLACALGAVVFAAHPALAQDGDAVASDRVVLSGDVDVPRGTQAGEIVVISGDVTIEGVARGDVVVLSGDVAISGHVSGDVIAAHGRVTIGADAQIRGDVLARERVAIEPGATVDGAIRERTAFTWRSPIEVFGRFASWLAVSVSTLVLGMALVALVPRGLDAAASVARASALLAVASSLAIAVAAPVLVVVFAASLVVLPLALVLLLGVPLLLFVGYASAAYALGRALSRDPRSRAVAFLFGWGVLRAVAAIPLLGGATLIVAGLLGLGAISIAAWRSRETGGRHRERRTTIRLHDVVREEAGL